MKNENKLSWYDKKWLVVILLIVFFPVGLYALWKNKDISKTIKIIVTVFIVVVLAMLPNNTGKPVFDLEKQKKEQLFLIAYDAEKSIKQNLKDPESFELISKDYQFISDTVYKVNITYSATNSFGGRIQSKYIKMGYLTFDMKDSTFTNTVKFEN